MKDVRATYLERYRAFIDENGHAPTRCLMSTDVERGGIAEVRAASVPSLLEMDSVLRDARVRIVVPGTLPIDTLTFDDKEGDEP